MASNAPKDGIKEVKVELKVAGVPSEDVAVGFKAIVLYDAATDTDYLRLWIPGEGSYCWLKGRLDRSMTRVEEDNAEFDELMYERAAKLITEMEAERRAEQGAENGNESD